MLHGDISEEEHSKSSKDNAEQLIPVSHFFESEGSTDSNEFKDKELAGRAFPRIDDQESLKNISVSDKTKKIGDAPFVAEAGAPKRSSSHNMRAVSASIAKITRLRKGRHCLIQIHNIRGIDLTMGGLSLFSSLRWLVLQQLALWTP